MASSRFPTTLSLLSFLIILLHTNLLAYSQNVLDTNGDSLRPGVEYIIKPHPSGVIGISTSNNASCQDPLDVVLRKDTNIVSPVRFSPANSTDNSVDVDTIVDIGFSRIGLCTVSTVWKIEHVSENQTTQDFVTTGGALRNSTNWFQIVSYESSGRYNINFCPRVCPKIGTAICRFPCESIGLIRDDNGITRLGVTSTPLQVSFVPFSSAVAPNAGL